MEVCEVCGAFLIVGDAQSRVDDHLMGKQHMGYAKIKSTVEELKVTGSYDAKNANRDRGIKTLIESKLHRIKDVRHRLVLILKEM